MAASKARRFLSAMAGGEVKTWHGYGPMGPLFEDDPEAQKAFQFMASFLRNHGRLPGGDTVQEATGVILPAEPGEPEWLHDELVNRRIRKQLVMAGDTVRSHLADEDPHAALDAMMEVVGTLHSERNRIPVADFTHAKDILLPFLYKKWGQQLAGVPWPWKYMEEMGGDVLGGEMVSTIGRPGSGKTWILLYMAMFVWMQLQQPIIFVSMEIMIRKLMERLAALYSGLPMDFFKDGVAADFFNETPTVDLLEEKLRVLQDSAGPEFIIMDGNLAATVDDIQAACEQYRPCAVFVDGAYLLKPTSKNSRTRVDSIYDVAEGLKQKIATHLDIPVFPSWQFNRESTKLKKGESPGLEHIAGGDAIGQLSSICMGLFEDEADDSPDEVSRRRVSLLKGRDGETGEFFTEWNFTEMKFGQSGGFETEDYGL